MATKPTREARKSERPRPTPAAAAEALVHRAFAERFVEAQYSWTSMLLDHLVATRRRIGDLDTALILGVLGLSALAAARRGVQQVQPGTMPDYAGNTLPPGTMINAHSLATITGIPRETVRRKLASLSKAGLIEQLPNGAWCLTADDTGAARAKADLRDLTTDAIKGLARVYARLVSLDEAITAASSDQAERGPA
jgi:DNA-binding transcriptional regulator YhcF (GntR family)